jgi:hypothetical protein
MARSAPAPGEWEMFDARTVIIWAAAAFVAAMILMAIRHGQL